MKAIQAAERGGYEALRLVDLPEPQPRAGQALVRVTSAGVTPLDRTVLAGLHPSARKLPLVPGNEGAGIVMNDPSGRFLACERVLFFAGPGGVAQDGTFAEITSIPRGNLASLPGEIADEIAAGLPRGATPPDRGPAVRHRDPDRGPFTVPGQPACALCDRLCGGLSGPLRSLRGRLVGQHPVLVAVDYQDRDADRGEIAAEVFKAGCDAAERGVGRCGDGSGYLTGSHAEPGQQHPRRSSVASRTSRSLASMPNYIRCWAGLRRRSPAGRR
jgi:hypothetical protein